MLLPFFLIMGRGGRNKLKTHLNTVLTPRLAGTQMTLNVVAIYLYCLHSFQTPVKQQPAAPKRALMPLTNSVQRHSRLNFLGIPPSSKKQHVTSPLDMGKSCTKSLFQSQIHSIFCFTLFSSGTTRFKGRLVATTPMQGKCLPKAELKSSLGICLESPHPCRDLVSSNTFFPLMSPNLLQLLLNFSGLFEHPDVSCLTMW